MFMSGSHRLHSSVSRASLFIYFHHHLVKIMCTSRSQVSCSNSSTVTSSSGSDSLLSPVGSISRPKSLTNSSLCSESTTSSVSSLASNYPKAPGFEREDQVHRLLSLASGRIQHIDNVDPFTCCVSLSFFVYLPLIICHVIHNCITSHHHCMFLGLDFLRFSTNTGCLSHKRYDGRAGKNVTDANVGDQVC